MVLTHYWKKVTNVMATNLILKLDIFKVREELLRESCASE